MKRFSFKKALALILSILLVMAFMPMSFSAESSDTVIGDGGEWETFCEATISVQNDVTALDLHFTKSYDSFTGAWTPQLDVLIPRAVETYNINHGTALATTDITKLVVTGTDTTEIYIRGFANYLVSSGYAAQLTELDLSGASFCNRWMWQDASEDNHTLVGDLFAYNGGESRFPILKTLKLGKGLTKIDWRAFNNMTSLEEIVLNDCITTITGEAFNGCNSLKALNLPASLNSIEVAQYTVSGCTNLTEISYHGASADTSLYNTILGYINLSTVTKVDLSGSNIDVAFALSVLAKENLTYLDISDCANIEYESDNGMLLWEKLEALKANGAEVLAPVNPDPDKKKDTVNGDGGEWEASHTARIIVEDGVVTLNLCFARNLDTFTGAWTPQLDLLIPRAIDTYNANHSTEIAKNDITKIVVNGANDAIEIYLIQFVAYLVSDGYANIITELDLSGIMLANRWMWQEASADDHLLRSDIFVSGDTVKFPQLKTLKLGTGLTKINWRAFYNMTSIEEIVFSESITNIDGDAFGNCTSLKSLNFPSSLNTLGDGSYVANNCTSLATVSYHGKAEGSADEADFYTQLMKIVNRASVTNVDLSGSGISTANALAVANKATLTSLDISDCANIDWNTDTGKALYSRIKTLISEDVTVKFTGSPELDVYASGKNTAQIIVEGSVVELSVYNASHYGKDEITNLANGAIANYNFNHSGAEIAITDITKVTVASAENAYILNTFRSFLSTVVPQVVEVDMAKANVYNGGYYSETDYPLETAANVFPDQYFGLADWSAGATSPLAALKKVILPENLKNMGNYTFMNCRTIEEIVLPRDLTTIGMNAFSKCEKLTTITVTNGTFGAYYFENAPVKNIVFVGGENDLVELSATEGNAISNATVYCADAAAYENGIGANLKTRIAKVVYVGDMADVTVKTDEVVDGYFLPVSATKTFAGWKTLSDTEVEAMWEINSDVKGDANNDGVVDVRDLIHLKKYTANIIDEILNDISDVDLEGDGIDGNELIIMRRAILGVESHDEYYERINAVA